MNSTIDKIQKHAKAIAAGEIEQVKPGMPAAFTDACTVGDTIRQGDLYLTIVAAVPGNYCEIPKPTALDKQLVPGNTSGAKHCLDALAGIKLYRLKGWNAEMLDGPCFVLTKRRKVLHPIHGAVTIPAGFTILCRYQREFDKELQKQRRARD